MDGSLKFGKRPVADVGKWSRRLPPEPPRGRAQGMGPDPAHHSRRPLPVRSGLPQEIPGSSTRAKPTRAPPRPALRPAGHHVRPHLQDQTEPAWCSTLLTNSVITWTTEYYGMGIGELRGQGRTSPTNCCRSSPPATARTSTSSASSASTSKPNSPNSSRMATLRPGTVTGPYGRPDIGRSSMRGVFTGVRCNAGQGAEQTVEVVVDGRLSPFGRGLAGQDAVAQARSHCEQAEGLCVRV